MDQLGRKKWVLLLLILVLLNYIAVPSLLNEYPVSKQADLNLSEVSSGTLETEDWIHDIYVDGDDGYLITNMNSSGTLIEMAYYTQDHQLLWTRPIDGSTVGRTDIIEIDSDYIVLINAQGTYGDNFGNVVRVANITVLNKAGKLVSQFPIDLETFANEEFDLSRGTYVIASFLDQNTIYIFENTNRNLANKVRNQSIILHSYEIISGETNWIRKIDSSLVIGNYRLFDSRQTDDKFILSLIYFWSLPIGGYHYQAAIIQYKLDIFQWAVTSKETLGLLWNGYHPLFMSEYEVLSYNYSSPSLYINSSMGTGYSMDLGSFNQFYIRGDHQLESRNMAHLSNEEMIVTGEGVPINGTIDDINSFLIYIRSSSDLRFEVYLMDEMVTHVEISDNKLFVVEYNGEKYFITIYQFTRLLLINTLRNSLVHFIPSLILIPILLEVSTRIIQRIRGNQSNQHL